MAVLGRRPAEGFIEGKVLERVHQMLLSAEHMRDAHLVIVHHNGKMVCGKAIRFTNNYVIMFIRFYRHRAEHQIMERDVLKRHFKAQHGIYAGLLFEDAAGHVAAIAEGALALSAS